jgi:coenzyme F420 hydrogenase subunit beta
LKLHKRNIGFLNTSLCSGCGVCVSSCPSNAISLTIKNGFFKAYVDEAKCTECGLCLKVCPNIANSNQLIPELEHIKYSPLIGYYTDVFLSYATDYEIRFSASSGGSLTALLIYLLDKELVDQVIVALPNENDPLYAKAVASSDISTIRKAVGSKYTQISLIDAIDKAIKFRGKKFAFVGLPCHIRALRNLERILKLQNIVIKLGLYCGGLPSAWASEYLLYLYNIHEHKVKKISYRGFGWPGYLVVELLEGEKLCVPEPLYWNSGFGQYFYDKCCFLCADHTAELADISFADPAGVEEVIDDRLGHTLIVARSKKGLKLLKDAEKNDYINLKKISDKYAVQGTTVLKKTEKDKIAIYKLLKVNQKVRYEYAVPYRLSLYIWIIDYVIGHKLAMNKKLWMFIPVWSHIVKMLHLGVEMISKMLKSV